MKLLSSLVAHIESLKAHNLHLVDELAKVRDFFEGKASADGAAKAKVANAATAAKVEDLHAQVDETVSEANLHIDAGSTLVQLVPITAAALPDVKRATMRCKMRVTEVITHLSNPADPNSAVSGEEIRMSVVGGDKVQSGYPADGVDEDNDFSRWSPSGEFSVWCANPGLFGKLVAGEKYYLDFTLANPAPAALNPEPTEGGTVGVTGPIGPIGIAGLAGPDDSSLAGPAGPITALTADPAGSPNTGIPAQPPESAPAASAPVPDVSESPAMTPSEPPTQEQISATPVVEPAN